MDSLDRFDDQYNSNFSKTFLKNKKDQSKKHQTSQNILDIY